MSLTVTAKRTAAGSLLTIRQDGYADGPDWDWLYESVRVAWPEVAKTIKRFLES